MFILFKFSIVFLCFSVLAACGEDYESHSPESVWSERECIDWNNNANCDATESSILLSKDGRPVQQAPIVIPPNSPEGLARLREEVFSLDGTRRLLLIAPADSERVDALTTLLWVELQHNPLLNGDKEKAKSYLTRRLGLVWDVNDATYQNQERAVRKRIIEAQTKFSNPLKGVALLLDSIIFEENISAALRSKTQHPSDTVLSLEKRRAGLSRTPTAWHFSDATQTLALSSDDSYLSIYNNKFEQIKRVPIQSTSQAKTQLKSKQASTHRHQARVDAYSGASNPTPTPPKPPVIPKPPVKPSPNPSTKPPTQPAPKTLTFNGPIIALAHYGENDAYLLSNDNDNSNLIGAARACLASENQKGLFKFAIGSDAASPTLACNQNNLTDMSISGDGKKALTFDAKTRRLYLLSTTNMREISPYYLQLSSPLTHISLNKKGSFALIHETNELEAYIIETQSMDVIGRANTAQQSITASRWLEDGDNLIFFTNKEWQQWRVNTAAAASILEKGSIAESSRLGSVVSVSANGQYYARLKSGVLSVYSVFAPNVIHSIDHVELQHWGEDDKLTVLSNESLSRYQLHKNISNHLQAAEKYLTRALVANTNTGLDDIKQPLYLPASIPDTALEVSWSGDLSNIEYQGQTAGQFIKPAGARQGTIKATINTYFRGEAVRWTKSFNITIKP